MCRFDPGKAHYADCTPDFRGRTNHPAADACRLRRGLKMLEGVFAPLPASSLFLHQLALCLLREVLEFEADPSRGEHRVLGAEIGSQFVDDVLVAAWRELGLDDSLRVGFGGVSEKAQMLRPPRPKSRFRRAVILKRSS